MGLDLTCHATALFNLATSKFIRCLAHGTYSDLHTPIELYKEALKLRDRDHPDRPATLLLLAQALASHLGRGYDEAIWTQIRNLLDEVYPDDSRERRTADVIIRTCRLYRAVNGENPTEVDSVRDLDRGAYVPPYGYFDEPRLLHKLGVAFLGRFQLHANLDDLDKSILLNREAMGIIPHGHDDRASIVTYLGRSFLKRIEVCGDLTDADMSVGLKQLGERVAIALDNASCGLSSRELLEYISPMSAADTALQYVVREFASLHISEVQSLIDEWDGQNGIATRCKKQLAVLLSFLGGEGEKKMHELLLKLEWPFKEYKTKETTQVLGIYVPYFRGSFAAKLGIALASTVLWKWRSVDEVLAAVTKVCCSRWPELEAGYQPFLSVKFKLPIFHILSTICDTLEGNDHVIEAVSCFRQTKNQLADDTWFSDLRNVWEPGE